MQSPKTAVEAFAPAKINLALHVTGQRSDGYHFLDSVVVFADVGDRLRMVPAEGLSLSVRGPRGAGLDAGEDNLVLRAARLFARPGGAAITLEKSLPVMGGVGGGSADAAAALRGLSRLWDQPAPDAAAALTLGADVPVCLAGRPSRMRGIGAELTPLDPLPDFWLVLVNPGVRLATPSIFARLEERNNPPLPERLPRFATVSDLVSWLLLRRNDLEKAAISTAPVVADAILALALTRECMLTRMSGSGATCFAVFESEAPARQAMIEIKSRHPDWWVAAGRALCRAPEPVIRERTTE